MANLMNMADLPSEDEEDEDFNPGEEEEEGKGKKEKGNGAPSRKRNIGAVLAEEGTAPAEEGESEEDEGGDIPEAIAPKKLTTKQKAAIEKTDQLWLQLNKKSATKTASQAAESSKGQGFSLASLCQPAKKPRNGDALWMRQLGLQPKKPASTAEQGEAGAASEAAPPKLEVSAAALAAARSAVAVSSQSGKPAVVTETRRFAGKEVQVVTGPAPAGAGSGKAAAEKKPASALDAMLKSLQPAKKANILEKSRSDWTGFKQEHAQVDEELTVYNKSSDKYLEKVDFLKRAELREYEIERDKRLGSDVRTRGRN